jgi:hypothetical protein
MIGKLLSSPTFVLIPHAQAAERRGQIQSVRPNREEGGWFWKRSCAVHVRLPLSRPQQLSKACGGVAVNPSILLRPDKSVFYRPKVPSRTATPRRYLDRQRPKHLPCSFGWNDSDLYIATLLFRLFR